MFETNSATPHHRILLPNTRSPTGCTSLAARGAWHIWVTTDQGQRGGRVSAAWPVESGYRATPPGLRLAPHRNHHVAPRVSMTLKGVWCTTSKPRVQAAPSVLEPARTTYSSEPSRFSAWESVFRLRSITSATPVHRGAPSGQTRPADGCRGGGRPPKCEPFALEPPRPTLWPAQCCFEAQECVR